MKRLLSLILVVVLCLGALSIPVLAAIPFKDVPTSQWYYNDVSNAYETGLINGKSATAFKPDDNLTYAEAVKLAACMNQRYTTGSVSLQNGNPWYQTYVDYCKTKKIIDVDYAWDQPATRAGYMEIFSKALPDSALQQINNIPDGTIPDVPMTHSQAAAIYKLYKAGILQGNDAAHSCNPGASIKRSEVSAILTRMMDSSKRIWFSTVGDQPLVTKQPADVSCNSGETASFTVEVTGGRRPYRYKWEFITMFNSTWQDAGMADNATMKITATDDVLYGGCQFRCVITDADGKTVTSQAAKLLRKEAELRFVTQPTSVSAEEFDNVGFLVEVEGGTAPYTFQWCTVGYRSLMVPVEHMPEVAVSGDSTSSRIEIKVGGKDHWTVTEPFVCVVTAASGKEIVSLRASITLKENVQPLTIDYQSGDQLLHTYQPGFTLTFSGGVGPYVTIWEAKVDGQWVNMKNLRDDVDYYESGWERSCRFRTYVGNDLTFRCVIFDSLGNSVASKDFHAFLN